MNSLTRFRKLNELYHPKASPFWFVKPEDQFVTHLHYSRKNNADCIRRVDARRMRRLADLFGEFYASFQLTTSFGFNWHALEECMCYLDEVWPSSDAYVVVVKYACNLLEAEESELEWFFKTFNDVSSWWSKPIEDNPPYNRSSKPFRCIMESNREWAHIMQNRLSAWNIDYTAWLEN